MKRLPLTSPMRATRSNKVARQPAAATASDCDTLAVDRAVSLPEAWALVAAFSGLIGAWRLLGVCKAVRVAIAQFLRTLPRLLVRGGAASAVGVAGSEV